MDKASRLAIVVENLNKYTGNKVEYARWLAVEYPEHSFASWNSFITRANQQEPDLFPDFENRYNSAIPKVWDGSVLSLARMLHRRDSSISLEAWRQRIRSAYDNGAITRTEKPNFIVEHLKKASSDGEDLWMAIEEKAKTAIANIEHNRWADIRMQTPEDKYIAIAFASDQHIGNPFCDHERLRLDTEMIEREPNCFVIHAGDYIDNFIVDKPRPAMKAPIPPSVQWKLCEHYLDMSGDSLMAIVAGNHDLWTAGMTDYDPLKKFAEDRSILYHAHELNIRLWVNDIAYHISVRHKRRGNSQIDPTRVIKKMWEDGEADFDIGVVGHHHVPVIAPFTKHGVERWAIRPGAYKIVDTFGEMCGFPRERPTCPVAILSPHSREIQVFSDLRHGIRTLRALNGEDENDEDLGF
jgi:predicted phosphodiesterase